MTTGEELRLDFFPQPAGFETQELGPGLELRGLRRHGGIITGVGPPGILQLHWSGHQAQSADVVQTLGFVKLVLTTTATTNIKIVAPHCPTTDIFAWSGLSLLSEKKTVAV